MGSMGGGGGTQQVQETAYEVELSKISNEQWNRYRNVLRPFEDKWIAGIRQTEGDKEAATGQVAAEVGKSYDEFGEQAVARNIGMGVNPNSGRFKSGMTEVVGDRAEATGSSLAKTNQAIDDRTIQGLQSAVAVGRGQAADALKDKASLAYQATSDAISKAKSKYDTQSAYVSGGMNAVGMGLAGWKNAGGYNPEDGEMYDMNTQKRIL